MRSVKFLVTLATTHLNSVIKNLRMSRPRLLNLHYLISRNVLDYLNASARPPHPDLIHHRSSSNAELQRDAVHRKVARSRAHLLNLRAPSRFQIHPRAHSVRVTARAIYSHTPFQYERYPMALAPPFIQTNRGPISGTNSFFSASHLGPLLFVPIRSR